MKENTTNKSLENAQRQIKKPDATEAKQFWSKIRGLKKHNTKTELINNKKIKGNRRRPRCRHTSANVKIVSKVGELSRRWSEAPFSITTSLRC